MSHEHNPSDSRFKSVARVVSGNLLEMYDFTVYGYYAKAISQTFFPDGDAGAAMLKTLIAFGAGFLMRPLGAIILGAYIDRVGRRKGLIATLGLMAVGSLLITCVPPYSMIGVLAPFLVLIGRLLQGFSAGVELGGVSIYLAEMSPPGQRGFYVCWQSASQQVAVVAAAFIGYTLGSYLGPTEMNAWGWRIPFLIGCLIVPFLFIIRRTLQETEEFKAKKHRPSLKEVCSSVLTHWRLVLTGMFLVILSNVSFYMITVFTPTFGEKLHLTARDSMLVTMCVGLSNLFWLPILATLSDRVGRRPVLLAFSSLTLVTAYPAIHWLVSEPSFERLLGVDLWLSFIYAGYNAAMGVTLTEIMPADARTAGFSLAYSLSNAIFGGFTPFICLWLSEKLANPAAPGIWMSCAAFCGVAATLLIFGLRRPEESEKGPGFAPSLSADEDSF